MVRTKLSRLASRDNRLRAEALLCIAAVAFLCAYRCAYLSRFRRANVAIVGDWQSTNLLCPLWQLSDQVQRFPLVHKFTIMWTAQPNDAPTWIMAVVYDRRVHRLTIYNRTYTTWVVDRVLSPVDDATISVFKNGDILGGEETMGEGSVEFSSPWDRGLIVERNVESAIDPVASATAD